MENNRGHRQPIQWPNRISLSARIVGSSNGCLKPIQSYPNFRKNPILCQWVASLQFQYTFQFVCFWSKCCQLEPCVELIYDVEASPNVSSSTTVIQPLLGPPLGKHCQEGSFGGKTLYKSAAAAAAAGCFRVKPVKCCAHLITSSVTQLLLNSKHKVGTCKKGTKRTPFISSFKVCRERGGGISGGQTHLLHSCAFDSLLWSRYFRSTYFGLLNPVLLFPKLFLS